MKHLTNIVEVLLLLAAMGFAFAGAWPGAFVAGLAGIILALFDIEEAIKEALKPAKDDPITDQGLAARGESLRQRQRTLSVRGGLPESREPMPPPPPKKAANPFKVGDRVLVKCVRMDGDVCAVSGLFVKVRALAGTSSSGWYEADECQLISKEGKFKVGDRVRILTDGREGYVTMNINGVFVVDLRIVSLERYAVQFPEELELICEKQS